MKGAAIVTIEIRKEPWAYATVLNDLAKYIEGNESVPDHWDEAKREDFYTHFSGQLSTKAQRMVEKLSST